MVVVIKENIWNMKDCKVPGIEKFENSKRALTLLNSMTDYCGESSILDNNCSLDKERISRCGLSFAQRERLLLISTLYFLICWLKSLFV